MQKFYTSTIQSGFIKSLLYNTPLPIHRTVTLGEPIIYNKIYIYDRNIIRCTKSGFLGGRDVETSDGITNKVDYAEYTIIDNYDFGDKKLKYTDDYVSKYRFYDTDTHERLGDYLRCYRDIYGVDLMPFYNCFSGRYSEGLTITDEGIFSLIKNVSYKTFKVPVKFNKTYTIAIDSQAPVYVAPVFMVGKELLYVKLNSNDTSGYYDPTDKYMLSHMQRHNSTSFRRPFTWRFDNYVQYDEHGSSNEKEVRLLDTYEKDMYLFIQVSSLNDSSLVVLEGNYTNLRCDRVIGMDHVWDLDEKEMNKLFLSELSLLQFSNEVRYPFANRLLEYLLLGVITSEEYIQGNIKRIQEDLGLYDTKSKYKDIWTNTLRKYIYDLSKKNKLVRRLDLNGFVDKDTEKVILRERKG